MADVNKDMEMTTGSETTQEVGYEIDSEVASLREEVNEIRELMHLGEEEAASKWTQEEIDQCKVTNDPLSSGAIDQAVSYGVPFSLFGFSVVFAVLVVIMFVVILFGKVFGTAQSDRKPAEKKQEPKKQEVKKQQNSMAEEAPAAPAAVAPAADDKGIVAAIVAAISSFRSANGENGGFRVVSFKKRK